MGLFDSKPWWKDKNYGWHGRGVRDFFAESRRLYLEGDKATAIEVLEWGKRFSFEAGSGGGDRHFDEMIVKVRQVG